MKSFPKSQFELTAMFFELDTPDLQPISKLILLYLTHCGNQYGANIYPSLNTIAKKVGTSKQTVITHLAKLAELKYIGIKKGGVINGKNVSNHYIVNMEKLGYSYDAMPDNVRAIR